MFIALTFAHFSSELLLKEQMIIPVKKTLNNAGHIDAKLIVFSEISPPKSSEIGCFLLIVSWRGFPPKFPVKSADISKNLPLKILRNLTFFRENPAKSADLSANFDFFLQKYQKSADLSANFDFLPAKIPRNRPIFPRICPWKSREILLFFPRNIRSPVKKNLTACILNGTHTIKTWTRMIKWNTYQKHEFEKPFTIVRLLFAGKWPGV